MSAETCTQYLVNTIDDLRKPGVEGCRYICSPPLRDASNHEPLWDYVRRGVLESVSTDHCPFSDEQKARGLDELQPRAQRTAGDPAPAGEALGRGRRGRADHAERSSSTAPARRSRAASGSTNKGAIAPGKDADIAVFDPSAPRAYGVANSFMNVDYDLYEGETASGSVRHTYCRGTLVYDRGEIRTAPGHGRYVRARRSAVARAACSIDADRVLADLRELRRAERAGPTARAGSRGRRTGSTRASGCWASSGSCR